MRALQVTALTGPDGVGVLEIEPPSADAPVVVDVAAAGIAFPDLLLSRGEYQLKLQPPFTLGVEAAGRVARAPQDSGLEVGQRVAAFGLGMAAEQVAAAPEMVLPVPDSMTDVQAAGLIMNYHTAHFALLRRGRLKAGDTVLIHGAAGGVGTAAIQVARGAGVRTIAVVSSDEKEAVAHEAGADDVIRPEEGWPKQVKALTEGRGVDAVLDPVGGDRVLDSLRSLAEEGRLVVVGFTGGEIPSVPLNRLLLKNIEVVGAAWGAFVGTRPELTRAIHADLLEWAAAGIVAPVVGAAYPLADGAQALRDLDARRATGKLVLEL
ncbi:MAG: NADPH:quinone oxidoreductase family protein [Solirubrobacteraceae bacterium]|nr:NADPH:quinone oxidoreductase family protein [Solirubrobacteraceae bacterium]